MHPMRLHPLSVSTLCLMFASTVPAADSSSPLQASDGDHVPSGSIGSPPVLEVTGTRVSGYSEDDLVGSYGQPHWSATRRFAEVRMYVIPEGQLDFEYWLFVDTPSRQDYQQARAAGTKATAAITQQYEVEMGLGHRLQADIYQVFVKQGSNNQTSLDATKLELRYALADWGKLWANPTLYAEWIQNAHGPDNAEFKLLLGDQLCPGWFWATNLVYQVETGDAREVSHECNSGISYDLIDRTFSIGAEDHVALVTDRASDGAGGFTSQHVHHWEVLVGPSIRAYPTPRAHVDLTVFAGCTTKTASTETVLIAGWEF